MVTTFISLLGSLAQAQIVWIGDVNTNFASQRVSNLGRIIGHGHFCCFFGLFGSNGVKPGQETAGCQLLHSEQMGYGALSTKQDFISCRGVKGRQQRPFSIGTLQRK